MRRRLTTSLMVGVLVAALLPGVAAAGNGAIAQPLYADGDVGCLAETDLSLPAGRVITKGTKNGIRFEVVFNGAAPDREYEITLNKKVDDCVHELRRYLAFTTNHQGKGVFRATYEAEPGTYEININVVTDSEGLDDPRHRELSTNGFVEIIVP